jgi:hypothetical protein
MHDVHEVVDDWQVAHFAVVPSQAAHTVADVG